MSEVRTSIRTWQSETHQVVTDRRITAQRDGLLAAIRWEEPQLVHLESCNSCGTNTNGGK